MFNVQYYNVQFLHYHYCIVQFNIFNVLMLLCFNVQFLHYHRGAKAPIRFSLERSDGVSTPMRVI